jgi:phosphoglycerate dehydrogenase-like enzyme
MVHANGQEILRTSCRTVRQISADRDEIASAISDVDAVIVRGPARLSEEQLRRGRRLRVVSSSGAGYDHIDVRAASQLGLPVLYAPGIGAHAVAEWVLGALVVAGRSLTAGDVASRQPGFDWSRRTGDFLGVELRGKTLGLVGLGNIGLRVARLAAAAFEMRVIGLDPALNEPPSQHEFIELAATLEEVLERSDFISLHLPLNDATRFLIDTRALSRMKGGSALINASRGGIVDEAAVADALITGRLRYAVFDVFESEPRIWESPLATAPNCVMSPHIAGMTDRATNDLACAVADGVVSALDGTIHASTAANPDVLANWSTRHVGTIVDEHAPGDLGRRSGKFKQPLFESDSARDPGRHVN